MYLPFILQYTFLKTFLLRDCKKTRTELLDFRPVHMPAVSLQTQRSRVLSRENIDCVEIKNKYHFLMKLGFYSKPTSGLIYQRRLYILKLEREKQTK